MENIETLINAISLNNSDFMLINAAEDRILHVTSRVMRLTGLKAGYNSFAAAKAALKIIQKKDLYSIAAYRKAVHSNSFILRDVKPIDYCYTCTYNIMINKQALTVGHKGFLLSLTEDRTPKLVLYVFTPSPFEKSGSCFFYNFKTRERIRYDNKKKQWIAKEDITLTRNEHITLLYSSRGKTTMQIADLMNVSPDTIKKYRKQIFKKLNVVSMPQAVSVATFFRLI